MTLPGVAIPSAMVACRIVVTTVCGGGCTVVTAGCDGGCDGVAGSVSVESEVVVSRLGGVVATTSLVADGCVVVVSCTVDSACTTVVAALGI